MTTWTLVVEQPGGHIHRWHGIADDRDGALSALVAVTTERIREMTVPTRYALDVDDEMLALLASGDADDGRPDIEATLELLDRMNLTDGAGNLDID